MGKVPQFIDIRLQYKVDSREGFLLRHFQTHGRKAVKEILLESTEMLWEPYAVFDSFNENMSFNSLKKLVDSSYQRCLSHYQNMSVDLGLINPGTHITTIIGLKDSHNLSDRLVNPYRYDNVITNNTEESNISSRYSLKKENNNSGDEDIEITDFSVEDIDDIKL
ncbi:MAG: hypothetical protein SWX82_32670 [Cyanobacteriota bacterium]|nr:hypothetical protein [Cyanobacteriota bacterium]